MFSLRVLKQHSIAALRRATRPRHQSAPQRLPAISPRDGKVHAIACELPAAKHCNLSCRACSHLSPLHAAHNAELEQVRRDLTILGKYFHAQHIRVMGGEPLLHPRLVELLKIVRVSGVGDRIRVVTNGVLLPRQGDDFWRSTDEVEISLYPGHELAPDQLDHCRARADAHDVRLRVKHFDRFRESHAELGTSDADLVRRIYRTCNIAHVWSSYNVADGYIFRCPESMSLPAVMECGDDGAKRDGLEIIDDADFPEKLLAYLQSPQPLAACANCLGSVGRLFDHEEVARKQWRAPQQHRTEDLLDEKFLRILEATPGRPWLCTRNDLENPANHELVEQLGLTDPAADAVG